MQSASQHQPRAFLERTLSTVIFLLVLAPGLDARQAPSKDLDTLMEKVLMRRKVNQEVLKDYVLNDVEQFEAIGPGEYTLFRKKEEYVWYVRDGIHVRSPVRKDGVTIGRTERKEYEDKWIRDEQERAKKKAAKAGNQSSATSSADQSLPDPSKPSFMTQIAEPRFVSEAYFLEFKFESGHYYLVGREKFDGRDVLVVEYYPSKLFSDDDEKSEDSDQKKNKKPAKPPSKKEQETDARIDRQMNKTSLITLWVDPGEFQIVKYTFNNVWMDFLPGGWMLRVDHLKASMEMNQAIPGIWLPRNISIQAGLSLAVGLYTFKYDRKFSDYKRAEVTTTIRPSNQEKQ
jgi:hypothetical protein